MERRYEGKVVGVTGAGSLDGIGFGIAKRMLQEGASVFICDLKQEALDVVVPELQTYGKAKGYIADVSSEEDVKNLFQQAYEDFGKIDVFVNNAGIYPQKLIKDMSVKEWDLVMNVNLKSVFLCAKECLNYMKETGGVLLNAASYAAIIPSVNSAAYAASKSAVMSLTRTLSAEFAPYNIRVNGFIPGVIATGMTAPVIEIAEERILSQIASHKLGTPDDVAAAVCFLGSDDASYLTGTFIEISGGKLAVQNADFAYQMKKKEEGE